MDIEQAMRSISSLTEIEQLKKLKALLEGRKFENHNDENFTDMQAIIYRVEMLVGRYREGIGVIEISYSGGNAFENFKLTREEANMYWEYKSIKDKRSQFYDTKKILLRGLEHFLKKNLAWFQRTTIN